MLLIGSLILVSFQTRASSAKEQRINIKGTQFVFEDGSPFLFLGGNLPNWFFLVERGEVYSKADIDEIVGNLATFTGAKMMRIVMSGNAFEPSFGDYDEKAFVQLDHVLVAAQANGIRLIIALRDYAWSPWPIDAPPDPYWLLGGGTATKPNKDAIQSDPQAKAAYKHFIQHVLDRVNSVNGEIYKNDTTIFAWELINEPHITYPPDDFNSWITEIGSYVRSVDSVHFLTVGIGSTEVEDWWGPENPNWRVLANPLISFVDLHYYAAANLYDPVDPSNVAKIRERVSSSLELNKPVVFGEFGAEGTSSIDSRIGLYKTIIETVLGNGASGALFFAWGPPGPNGWGGPNGFEIYVDQWKQVADLVLQESIKWTGFERTTTTSTNANPATSTGKSTESIPLQPISASSSNLTLTIAAVGAVTLAISFAVVLARKRGELK